MVHDTPNAPQDVPNDRDSSLVSMNRHADRDRTQIAAAGRRKRCLGTVAPIR
jgi:hypothetical protein